MDKPLLTFLVLIAAITALPAWLTGSILKKASKEDQGGGTDWVPMGYVVYGLTRFHHSRKAAIVGAYIVSNILSWGAILWLVVYVLKNRT